MLRHRFVFLSPLVAGLALALPGCGTSVSYAPLNPSPVAMKPRPASGVHVYRAAPPSEPFTEVGIIRARQSSEYSVDDMPELIGALREEAGRRGCHAIIITGNDGAVVGRAGDYTGLGNEGSGYVSSLDGYAASCIVFAGEPPAAMAESLAVERRLQEADAARAASCRERRAALGEVAGEIKSAHGRARYHADAGSCERAREELARVLRPSADYYSYVMTCDPALAGCGQ